MNVGTGANQIPQLNGSAQIALSGGAASAPAYAFAADPTSGLFSPGSGAATLATSGSARLSILSNGNVGIGTTAPPPGTLDVESGTAGASTDGSPINLVAQTAGTGANNNGGNVNITARNVLWNWSLGLDYT